MQASARRFWELNNTRNVLVHIYRAILKNPYAHSFIGLINNKPVCQVDVYALHADELGEYIEAGEGDCGIHLLMCPPREMQKGWSKMVLQAFTEFYFSFPEAKRLYAEPDQQNYTANQLAICGGFTFLETVELCYKTANLYVLDRSGY